MDFVEWVKDIVYMCARSIICDEDAYEAMCDQEVTELAEDIANQVELEINAQRQENKVPPIPQEILRKLDDTILYGAHPETVTYRVPVAGTPCAHDIDRICSMSAYELEQLRTEIDSKWKLKTDGINWNIQPEPVKFHIIQPKPVKVWFNPPYTTVEFSDGDKVTVEQTDFEDSKFSEYAGYCCAVTKKLFGTSTAAFKRFEEAKKKAIEDSPKFKKAEANKFEKTRKAIIREEARKRREFQIKMEMERLKTEQEARKRLEADK